MRGNTCKLESTGELFRLMAIHRGGLVIPCETDNRDLDILCTNHGDHLYLSVINRKDTPVSLSAEGYEMAACNEIHTGNYSFDCNDYTVDRDCEPIVHGHSILFAKLTPKA